jgi:glutamate racemase
MSSSRPIGIFDSGIGGLSVVSHIRACLPAEDLIYVADNAHLPYGDKSCEYVNQRAQLITTFLLRQGVKSVVVACNTATAAAIANLRSRFKFPIVGMEPGVKPGIARSHNGRVAILATEGTLGSAKFRDLLQRFSQQAEVSIQPCHGWVELVEGRHPAGSEPAEILRQQLTPLLREGVDTLVLGCTHYPFLREQIARITGDGVSIIDTGEAVARQLKRRLAAEDLLNPRQGPGGVQFWSSLPNPTIAEMIDRLWGDPGEISRLPETLERPGRQWVDG